MNDVSCWSWVYFDDTSTRVDRVLTTLSWSKHVCVRLHFSLQAAWGAIVPPALHAHSMEAMVQISNVVRSVSLPPYSKSHHNTRRLPDSILRRHSTAMYSDNIRFSVAYSRRDRWRRHNKCRDLHSIDPVKSNQVCWAF